MLVTAPALNLTAHASHRLAQRQLGEEELTYVLTHGTDIQRTGVTFVVLRRRDVPQPQRRSRLARLEGTVLILAAGCVITAYHSRKRATIVRELRKKTKYRWSHGQSAGFGDIDDQYGGWAERHQGEEAALPPGRPLDIIVQVEPQPHGQ
jgi:hypothetical protein